MGYEGLWVQTGLLKINSKKPGKIEKKKLEKYWALHMTAQAQQCQYYSSLKIFS